MRTQVKIFQPRKVLYVITILVIIFSALGSGKMPAARAEEAWTETPTETQTATETPTATPTATPTGTVSPTPGYRVHLPIVLKSYP